MELVLLSGSMLFCALVDCVWSLLAFPVGVCLSFQVGGFCGFWWLCSGGFLDLFFGWLLSCLWHSAFLVVGVAVVFALVCGTILSTGDCFAMSLGCSSLGFDCLVCCVCFGCCFG